MATKTELQKDVEKLELDKFVLMQENAALKAKIAAMKAILES